ncbi:3-keto-5-aminohexanoate cleavage protein [Labrys okinawensis]|uniref:3-keto-5-aminohexanoate cleavage protein n=1 Tax=Labrys okinawensis TaxID=346911 RepID=UPI0039BC8FE5
MEAQATGLPVILAVAPNGGRRSKADQPALPMTALELVHTAADCLEAGAAMIHTHVRKPDGGHLLDAEAYRTTIAAIRAAVGDRLVIQITSEALGLYAPAEQRAVVQAVRPEAVSLALRELLPDASEEIAFADFLTWLKREEVTPQIILYTPQEAQQLDQLRKRGLLPWEDIAVLYVLGRYTPGQVSGPRDLLPFLAPGQPVFGPWSVCAFGRWETACVTSAALLGGHARVGFESNLYRPDGTVAQSNGEMVSLTRRAIEGCGLRLGTADDLRAMLRT